LGNPHALVGSEFLPHTPFSNKKKNIHVCDLGALDCRATAINEEIKQAATRAIAEIAKSDPLLFGRDYIIPKPFDPRLKVQVSAAVVEAAMASGTYDCSHHSRSNGNPLSSSTFNFHPKNLDPTNTSSNPWIQNRDSGAQQTSRAVFFFLFGWLLFFGSFHLFQCFFADFFFSGVARLKLDIKQYKEMLQTE
jgi:hypothetical protein